MSSPLESLSREAVQAEVLGRDVEEGEHVLPGVGCVEPLVELEKGLLGQVGSRLLVLHVLPAEARDCLKPLHVQFFKRVNVFCFPLHAENL